MIVCPAKNQRGKMMAKTQRARTIPYGAFGGGMSLEKPESLQIVDFSPEALATMHYLLSLLHRGKVTSKELEATLDGASLNSIERDLIRKRAKSGLVALGKAIAHKEMFDKRQATRAAGKRIGEETRAERAEIAEEEIAKIPRTEPEVDEAKMRREAREAAGLPKTDEEYFGELAEKYPPKEEAPPERKEVPPERTETPTPKVEAEEPSPPVTLEAATALEDEARRIIHLVQAGRIPPDAADGPFRDIMSRLSQTGWPTSDLISKYAAAADTATPVSRVLGAGPDVEAMATERMRATPEGRDVLRREGEGKAIEGRLEERGEKLSPTQRVLAESIPHVPGEAAREALLRQFLYATATPEEKSAMVAEAEETRSQLRRISYGYAGPPVRFGTGGAVRETEPPTEEQQAARLASSLRERAFLTGGTRGRTAVERVLAAGGTEEEALASLSKARLENIREHRARSPLQIALARRPVEPGSPLRTTDWLQRTYGGGPRLPTFRR